jgi:hypothetical protein
MQRNRHGSSAWLEHERNYERLDTIKIERRPHLIGLSALLSDPIGNEKGTICFRITEESRTGEEANPILKERRK